MLAGVLLGSASVPVAAPWAAAGAEGRGPLDTAREAGRRVPFSARIEVSWVDRAGLHTAELGVRSVGGQIRVQSSGGTGEGLAGGSALLQASAAAVTDDAGGDLLVPALERKYDVERGDGPVVAGRPTELFVLRSKGAVREKLAIDRASSLVLRREVFGAEGRPVRIVNVLQLDTAPVPEAADAGARASGGPEMVRVGRLPAAYRGPEALAGGFRRVGAYRHERLVQVLYTDGLHGMSLFSQPGTLSGGTLPPGGEAVRVGSTSGLRYTWSGGEVVTWQTGHLVHTLVGDATPGDLLAAARSLPRASRPSWVARLRGTSRLVAELVSGGR